MANELTHVVVSIHVESSNPILPIIKVEEVITDGAGTLLESIMGGQVKLTIQLSTGKEVKAQRLKQGDFVYIRGMRNGAPFVFNNSFTTEQSEKPWEFSRVSGSTG